MTASDTINDSPRATQAPARPVRPFFWSVRRELWENHAIWIAPLAVAALVIFGSLIALVSSNHLKTVNRTTVVTEQTVQPGAAPAGTVTVTQTTNADGSISMQKVVKIQGPPAPPPTPEQRRALAQVPFYIIAAAMIFTMFLVAVFYCLGALYNERRDRSILFWKSLPVRDLTTVMSKIVVPMAILPAVTLAIAVGTQLLMFAIGALGFATHGSSPDADVPIPFGQIALITAYGVAAMSLWWAPLYAWLILVSGWAKRAPFLWAVLPPLGIAIAEKVALNTNHIGDLIESRVAGGYLAAFVTPKKPMPGASPDSMLPHIDAEKFISAPGLWLGLLAAAAMIAAAVWMRRRREPV